MKVKFLLLALFLCGVSSLTTLADKWTLGVPKNTVVTVKIPGELYTKQAWTSISGRPTYFTHIDQGQDGSFVIGGKADWKNAGWIWMTDLAVKEIDFVKNKEWQGTEVSLTNANFIVRLRFHGGVRDVAKAFSELTYVGALADFQKTDEFKRDNPDKYFPLYFPGPMAKFTEEEKYAILKAANYTAKDKFGLLPYKGKNYFFVNDESTTFYNNRRFSKPQRVAMIINESLLGLFKVMYKQFGHYELEGIKVGYNIKHMDLVTSDNVGIDFVEIYAPMDVLKAFGEDEIVSQEFIDKCIVLVDNNRTKVDLSLQ
jgi:hypothetical protein